MTSDPPPTPPAPPPAAPAASTPPEDTKVLAGADGVSRVSGLPSHFPPWAAKLAELYFSGTTSSFILHGNVFDLVRMNADGSPWRFPERMGGVSREVWLMNSLSSSTAAAKTRIITMSGGHARKAIARYPEGHHSLSHATQPLDSRMRPSLSTTSSISACMPPRPRLKRIAPIPTCGGT